MTRSPAPSRLATPSDLAARSHGLGLLLVASLLLVGWKGLDARQLATNATPPPASATQAA